jgi:protein O-GlcNAc transferase
MNQDTPARIQALVQSASAAERRGDRDAALASYRQVLVLDPTHPGALLRIAQAGLRTMEHAEVATHTTARAQAIEQLRRAIESARSRGFAAQAMPIYAELLVALRGADATTRLQAVRQAQSDCGELPGLIWEECECLRALGRSQERLYRLNRLAALQSRDPVILAELGLALIGSNSAPQAIGPMRDAIALGYNDDEFALALAAVEIQNNALGDALQRLDRLREKNPTHFGALALRWHVAMQCCDWALAQTLEKELLVRIERGEVHRALTPWRLLASDASPELMRDYAKSFARIASATTSASEPQARRHEPITSARLRVGYLSSDFHRHATALLLAGVFEHHDRSRFEVFAYSYGARVNDDYQRRLRSQFEHWRELNELSDRDAAALIAEDGIDVLVELKGHTYGARPGIAALRPAPVQAHYLGYPGTLAMTGIDYLIADEIVAPAEHEAHFVETVVRLPGCYQAYDDRRTRPQPPSRAALGLPEDAMVLCNFNQSWKWSQPFVDIWLRTLAEHPTALLWLLDPGVDHPAKQSLQKAAARFGVAARIVWVPSAAPEAHLARLAVADLALDQCPCNSHTTAADALSVGVPVLTCLGERFDGRVAASLLQSLSLPELVAHDMANYERRLRELLDRSTLNELKTKLANALAAPERSSASFTAQWERLLEQLHRSAKPTG